MKTNTQPRWVERTFTMRLDVGTYGSEPDDAEIAYLLRMGGIDAEEVGIDAEEANRPPTPEEVVAEFIASEVGFETPEMVEQAKDLIAELHSAGYRIVEAMENEETGTTPEVPKAWQDRPLEWVEHVLACSSCQQFYLDRVKALVASGRLRAVPADTVKAW